MPLRMNPAGVYISNDQTFGDTMESILNFLFSQPSFLRQLGILLAEVSGIIGIIGIIGRVVTTAANTSLVTKQAQPEKHLADVMTGFPTFWVPESTLGFGLVCFVFVIGLTVAWIGKDIERKLRY
jgi:hypothetical protein